MEPQPIGTGAAGSPDRAPSGPPPGQAPGPVPLPPGPDRLEVRIGDLGVVLEPEPATLDAAPDGLPALRRLLDDLEHLRGPDVTRRLALAAAAEDRARALGAETELMRARLVLADMSHASGEVELGARLAQEVNDWAAGLAARSRDQAALLARSHLVISTVLERAGDGPGALDHAVRAVELLPPGSPPRTRGNHVMRLADALGAVCDYEAARRHYRDAERVFVEIGDVERRSAVLNNLADTELAAGQVDLAWEVVEELLTLSGGLDRLTHPADHDTVAKAMLATGRVEQAERSVRAGLALLAEGGPGGAASEAELSLTLARVLRAAGDLAAAQQQLDRCRALCEGRGLHALAVDVLGEQAELHAAAGRFEQAYATHREFYTATVRQAALQRDSAAHARQAQFETTEARRQAARFRDQARRDPLTGLRNRRYVDEELPRLLRLPTAGSGLVAAIVDADHFKAINDTRSHQTGDLVIRTLAALLSAAVDEWRAQGHPTPGFAARLGGEEFLVVLAGGDGAPDAAVAALERMRAGVQAYGWRPVVGDLPVTVSVGAALAGPGDSQYTLLARADRNLYAAKSGGRNRVVADPPGAGASSRAIGG